jgi:hypothetical protein
LTNKCSQESTFVLKTALPLFPRPKENTVKAKNDKAKIDFKFWVLHFIAATIDANNKT